MTYTGLIKTGTEPYLFSRGPQACLIVHGFNSSTRENREMGQWLADQGFTVLGIRLPGHATTPADMRRVRWTDWLAALEDGWNLLKGLSDRVFIMGQSLGGVLTMVAGSRYAFDGVIGISTPYSLLQGWQARLLHPGLLRFASLFLPEINKPALSDNPDEVDERVPKFDPDPYPRYVTHALAEVLELIEVMHDGLPQITAPLLLIQGRHDIVVEKDAMHLFGERVSSKQKEYLWMENSGHGITLSPEREIAFKAILEFIKHVERGQRLPEGEPG
jgi:carboxylesterase